MKTPITCIGFEIFSLQDLRNIAREDGVEKMKALERDADRARHRSFDDDDLTDLQLIRKRRNERDDRFNQ